MTAKKKTTKKKAAKKASRRPPKPTDISGKKASRPPKKKASAKKKTKARRTHPARHTPTAEQRKRMEDRFNDTSTPDGSLLPDDQDQREPSCHEDKEHHWSRFNPDPCRTRLPGGQMRCKHCELRTKCNHLGRDRYRQSDGDWPLSETPPSTGCPPEHTIPPGKAVAPLSDFQHEPEPPCPVSPTHHWHRAPGDKEKRCLSCELVKYGNRRGCDRYRLPGESTALEKYEGIPASDPLVFGTLGQLRVLLNTGDLTLRVYLKVHTVALAASRLLETLNPPPDEDNPSYALARGLSSSSYRSDTEDDPRPTSSNALDREDILVKGIQSQFATLLATEKVTATTFTKIAHLADFALVGVGQVLDKELTVHPDDIPGENPGMQGFSNSETFGAKTMRGLFDGLKPKPSLVPIVQAIAKAKELELEQVEGMLMDELKDAIAS